MPIRAPSGRCCSQIASRPIDTNPTYTVGSDVSRFQRSTVPGRAARPRATMPVRWQRRACRSGIPADRPMGPVVRVARGNNVTLVPVGAR